MIRREFPNVQNLDLQKEALKKEDYKRIYEDHMSGLRNDRPGLQKALEQLCEGDTFVVWKLDRLGRIVKPGGMAQMLKNTLNIIRHQFFLKLGGIKLLKYGKTIVDHHLFFLMTSSFGWSLRRPFF